MTSSHADTSKDSLPMNHPKNDAEFADKRNVGNIDNEAVIEEQTHSENNNEEERATASKDAQVPEATIKMETVAPDVVVASLETPEDVDDSQPVDEFTNNNSDIEFTDTAEAFFQEKDKTEVNAAANKTISNQNHAKDTETQKLVVEKKRQENVKQNLNSLDIDNINDKKNNKQNKQEVNKAENTRQTANKALEGDNHVNIDNLEDEEIKEKKEAKLESYKQFVAEQFSNKKVDYPEVRVRIEANALPSKMYFVMNILSAIIASYGLVTNSAAVVIGAMLVAMMLGPITGVALAIIDHRMPLLRKSLITVFLGISLVVLVGFIVGWLHKDQPLTVEILSRTQPTSMDLMIALAGGTAGAYAMVSPHLSVAVVGVAVATALVPPLAASGILFANGEMQMGLGALLLALTNIIAIQFTNALVLWLLGFRRLVDDDYKSSTYWTFLRRNAVTLLLLGVLGTYLTINLQTNAKQQGFESSVKETINSYFSDKGNVLTNTQFDKDTSHQVVRAVIRGETTPTFYDVRQIEAIISKNMAEHFPDYLPIKLQLRYMPVQVIESHPLIQDKLDKTDVTVLTN
ncbi:TIGR00341 family protein [Psychrobacter sp. YGAH215]|uniref:TIGR00341 family protein n=1 Tax=Psychrobacter sp. YGAH215 TaxID=2596826 RepID=UPI001186B05F|nr:TIGR00341 family protein [Psychrobacter sp. YGAH215]TSB24339.1 TIGR00341 family protein [Psychrobacter sp. YGAH215]